VQAGEVEQNRAQERQGDTDGADDDVLPGRFQRRTGPAVADEECCRHSGGLDRYPHHPDVVRQDRERHRGKEDGDQHAIQVGALAVGVPLGELGVDVADAGPGRQGAHGADDDEHGHAECVGPEQAPDTELRPGPDVDTDGGSTDQHRQCSKDCHGSGQPAPTEQRCEHCRGERSEDRQ